MSEEHEKKDGAAPSDERASAEAAADEATADDGAADDTANGRSSDEGDAGSLPDDRESVPPALPPGAALPLALVVTVVVAVVVRYAFHAEQSGSWAMLLAMFGVQVPFAALAVVLLAKEGKLAAELLPRRGDLTFGALVAGLMYGAGMAVRQVFLGPDTPRSWWVANIYMQLGDMSQNRMIYVGFAVLIIAMLEELVWRGLVMRSLRRPFGPLRAWLVSSVLYAAAHAATITVLSNPVAGPNPLLVVAALGGGLVWGHLYNRTGRLAPGLFAHALFSWAIVDFPLWRP